MSDQNKLSQLKDMISSMERTLFAARSLVSELSGDAPLTSGDSFLKAQTSYSPASRMGSEGKIIEGAFDGQNMMDGEGSTYPVPVNYASKSKMVVGDRMKLTIGNDGKFVYKQIGPVNRRNVLGPLTCEDGQYKVLSEGKEYKILTASITFHKAEIGDTVSVLLPQDGDPEWAAFDAVVPEGME